MADELREDTMVYRKPTDGSDEASIQDIWGQKLETRVVASSDVPALLAEGWAAHPLDIGKKPEERAGFVRELGGEEALLREALEAEKRETQHLADANKDLAVKLSAAEEANRKLQAELAELKKAPSAKKDG